MVFLIFFSYPSTISLVVMPTDKTSLALTIPVKSVWNDTVDIIRYTSHRLTPKVIPFCWLNNQLSVERFHLVAMGIILFIVKPVFLTRHVSKNSKMRKVSSMRPASAYIARQMIDLYDGLPAPKRRKLETISLLTLVSCQDHDSNARLLPRNTSSFVNISF